MSSKVITTLLLATVMGCSSYLNKADEPATPQPALLIEASKESTDELSTAATQLFNQPVLLGVDAFTLHSSVSLERTPHKAQSGQLIMGRSIETPHSLSLISKAGHCYLKNNATDEVMALSISKCKKVAKEEH
jgi:hypothetical protein